MPVSALLLGRIWQGRAIASASSGESCGTQTVQSESEGNEREWRGLTTEGGERNNRIKIQRGTEELQYFCAHRERFGTDRS